MNPSRGLPGRHERIDPTEQQTGLPAMIDIPTDRPRTGDAVRSHARRPLALPETTYASLDRLGQDHGVTIEVTLLATFQLLLSQWSSQDNIVIAWISEDPTAFVPVALQLRTNFSDDPPFHKLLERVKHAMFDARAVRYAGVDNLSQRGWPDKSSRQILFTFREEGEKRRVRPDTKRYTMGHAPYEAGTELVIEVTRTDEVLTGEVGYATDLFESSTIDRLADRYSDLLRAVASTPKQRASDLQILAEHERERLTHLWNDTTPDYPQDRCLPALFADQVILTPDATAVCCEGSSLTYRELDSWSDRVAAQLLRLSIGPESVVALCVERSLEMLVGMIGILKAGGAYLPLDPAYPPDRLALMLNDAAPSAMLTEGYLTGRLQPPKDCIVLVGEDWKAPDGGMVLRSAEMSPDHPAYVIYTSGSTGTPKGVVVSHRAVVNFLTSMARSPGLDGSDVLVATTPISFDIAGLELFLPLLVGARVELVGRDVARDGVKLRAFLENVAATVFQATPATWRALTDAGGAPGGLKALCGGEALPRDLAETLSTGFREAWNLYGPTETTIWSTVYRLSVGGPVLIGHPIANTRLYVLDRNLQLVPVGVSGELYIGGIGLARGYLRRPGLTADRFIPNPFGHGDRLYRTGDLVRRLASGDLEYLGRLDQQVKLRGFRIELSEIEATLHRHPAIRRAVVALHEDRSGDKSLVAYIIARDIGGPVAEELRAHLRRMLPDHMIPSVFMPLDEVPLTPSGKVDRQALPPPPRRSGGLAFRAPRTLVEQAIVSIWEEQLDAERIGIDDDFFALGGHSLAAIRVLARLRERYSVAVPVTAIFETPTVAGLAARLSDFERSEIQIQALPRPQEVPLSFAQHQLWFVQQLQGGTAYNLPFAMRLTGNLDVAKLIRSIEAVVERHEVLRTFFCAVDGLPTQVVNSPSTFRLELDDIADLAPAERQVMVDKAIGIVAAYQFDLASQLPLKLSLIRLARDQHLLLAVFHHIAFDGWSLGIFADELSRLYRAHADDRAVPLALQYADFAVWQRRNFRETTGEVARQLTFWRAALAGAPPLLELPTDRPRLAGRGRNSGVLRRSMVPGLRKALDVLAARHGLTLFMTLHAALALVLSRWAEQEDVVIGTVVANRTHSTLEHVIGLFANTVPLRLRLSADMTIAQLLAQVREVDLAAFSHQDLPFSHLIEGVSPGRNLLHSPIFQIMLVLQNAPFSAPSLGEVKVDLVSLNDMIDSQYDIVASLTETSAGELGCTLHYDASLFDENTALALAVQFETLLSNLVEARSDAALSDLTMQSAAERHKILVDWNRISLDVTGEKTIPDLFEAQVARTHERYAAVFGGERLTYREMNERANRLARHLISFGIGAEDTIGIALDRSLDLVVAQIAAWKAGAAFLSLDPNYPPVRLAYMMSDARLSLILTRSDIAAILPEVVPVVVMDDSATATRISGLSGENLSDGDRVRPLHPQNLACLIYTSGSTGQPKGAGFHHAGIANLARALIDLYEVDPESRVLQLASPNFDASLSEIIIALLSGAQLVLASLEQLAPGRSLSEHVDREQVTHMVITPSVLAAMDGWDLPSCKVMTVAGEACHIDLVRRWSPGRLFLNSYGPTECTVCTTVSDPIRVGCVPPIGRSIPHSQAYVVDALLQLCPIGVPGELLIGGAGLTRGYFGRPGLTAERFVASPFGPPGSRLYRTGDLARRRADGQLEYLGRIDQQVKIRGCRVELGEIEAALHQHPSVANAAVIAREDQPGKRRLVGYLVKAASSSAPTVGELRRYLTKTLPDHMIPAAWAWLDMLPRTPNGKLDQRALSVLEEIGADSAPYRAPITGQEAALADLFSELLGRERTSVDDNFFDLGGHSLLAAQLVARIRHALGRELSIRTLFENPTVRGLAERLGHRDASTDVQRPDYWNREMRIPGGMKFRPAATPLVAAEAILLTGATGLVGAALASELLTSTSAEIYCLTRAETIDDARNRLYRSLDRYGAWAGDCAHRIHPILGDLRSESLGIDVDTYASLDKNIDAIFHCGAQVNFIYPYQALKAANVGSTLELLKLAGGVRSKSLHFISTMSVLSAKDLSEDGDPAFPLHPEALEDGYSQSKWVADRIVAQAFEGGLDGRIYRMGHVCGNSRTGALQTTDFVFRLVKASIELGQIPKIDGEFTMVPVDIVSRAIVWTALQPIEDQHCVLHLEAGRSLPGTQIIEGLRRFGYAIQEVPFEVWRRNLLSLSANDPDRIPADVAYFAHAAGKGLDLPWSGASNTKLKKQLASFGHAQLNLSGLDESLLDLHLRYFASIGFLPTPGTSSRKVKQNSDARADRSLRRP